MNSAQRSLIFYSTGVLLFGSLFWWTGHSYLERREQQRETEVIASARQLALATFAYEQDHTNHFPDAGKWEQELRPYLGPNATTILHPPAPFRGTMRRFALNAALSGKWMGVLKSPSNVPMFFESVAKQPSASDDLASVPAAKDGGHRFAVVYTDGHAYTQPPTWRQFAKEHPDEAGGMLLANGQMN